MSFSGIVIHGKQLGRTIGYPTANIALEIGSVDDGVYALEIVLHEQIYQGVGTYRRDLGLFEAHIFDFDMDIYGEMLSVTPLEKIRDNQKFSSFDALKEQISKDAIQARSISNNQLSSMYPTLDSVVLDTIDLYINQKELPKLDLRELNTPLVVGSGNGFYTGRILFRHLGAFFATESEVSSKLANIDSITDVVVISASGEKHAPIILNTAKKHHKKTLLISSSPKSSGRDIADVSVIMPRVREPYTYNTSTYFGYMLAETPDLDLVALREFITGELTDALSSGGLSAQDPLHPGTDPGLPYRQDDSNREINFADYSSFFIVIPNEFVLLREMFEVKFIELFGRRVARDIFSYEQMKHATTVVQDDKELFLCFGNTTGVVYGANQVNLPIFTENSQKQEIRGRENFSKGTYSEVSDREKSLSDKEVRSFSEFSTSYAAMMLVGYYLIGKIQTSLPPYFMDSIEDYCQRARAQSGFDISPWVEV